MESISETIYLLSANAQVEFKWYRHEAGETQPVQGTEPESWVILNRNINRIHPQHDGFALVYDSSNRPHTIFTGLLAKTRMSGGGRIQDTFILVSPDQALTENQKLLMHAFFHDIGKTVSAQDEEFYNFSCLSGLSNTIEDELEHGISLSPYRFNEAINSLRQLVQTHDTQEVSTVSIPAPLEQSKNDNAIIPLAEGIYPHTQETRRALADTLLTQQWPFQEQPHKPVVAIITQFVRAKNLGNDVIWGLTDDPSAGKQLTSDSPTTGNTAQNNNPLSSENNSFYQIIAALLLNSKLNIRRLFR
ncbi:hypothetical protein [Nitrosomonas sp.]|uniref:hypothetical protein n=1 Tax=Nitrosomonas sp. TaxID=42353 RepID=UPI00284ADD13|nr:hypothetical protein [Nitrosomonas sp.]MDR4515734.1 hypothetical protein [Nitrosomonas sp.]